VPAEKSFADSLTEIKEEVKNVVQTRAQLLKAETAEKWGVWKRSLILLAVAGVLLLTCWFTLAFSLVALFRGLLTSDGYAWFWGGVIAGILFLGGGLAAGATGIRRMKSSGLTPARTLKVLQQDRDWAQKQVRSA
jgi:hypothetical protein